MVTHHVLNNILLTSAAIVTALPVAPWPEKTATSPVAWTPWLVNWDISYNDNSTDLLGAIELSDPDIFEWDFGTENNRQHELTRLRPSKGRRATRTAAGAYDYQNMIKRARWVPGGQVQNADPSAT